MSPQKVKLGEICDSIDYGFTASANVEPVGPKFLRITDIQNNSVNWETVPYCPIGVKEAEKKGLKPGDIVFARTGATTGKSFLIRSCPDKAVFASYLIRVRPNLKLKPEYLAHFFQTNEYWQHIEKNATGTAQGGVNATILKELEIPLPPLSEQERIASRLDAADRLRAQRRDALKRLDALTHSLFLDAFGDPAHNPKNWPLVKLGELGASEKNAIRRGPFGGAIKKEFFTPNGFKIYEQGNVIYNDFKRGSYFIPEPLYRKLESFRVQPGDILISCSGTIGKLAIVPTDAQTGIINQALLKITLDATKTLPVFFRFLFENKSFQNNILGMSHGSGMKNLQSVSVIKEILIPLPPLSLQLEFASRLEQIESLRARMETSRLELDALFASLQSAAFGEA